ncbi:Hydroxyacylglutathione hydrolase [uncultured Gammaproteobacteria bacterium]
MAGFPSGLRMLYAHNMEIEILPALKDNYIFVLREVGGEAVAVVDPTDATPVHLELERRGLHLTHIFNTHHHGDHIGGNLELIGRYDCEVIGPRSETDRIPDISILVGDEDTVAFGNHTVRVFDTPGHTRGHVCYWFADQGALFTGDTLFALGCGRLFEGTPAQMWSSLLKLRSLPETTQIYCGHEYTLSNLRFALAMEPGNAALVARAEQIYSLRDRDLPTVPSTMAIERETNPFLRVDLPEFQNALGMAGAYPVDVFAEIRRRKDCF